MARAKQKSLYRLLHRTVLILIMKRLLIWTCLCESLLHWHFVTHKHSSVFLFKCVDPMWLDGDGERGFIFDPRHCTEYLVNAGWIGVWWHLSLQHSPERPTTGAVGTHWSRWLCYRLGHTCWRSQGRPLRSAALSAAPTRVQLKIVVDGLCASNFMPVHTCLYACSYKHICVLTSIWTKTKLPITWAFRGKITIFSLALKKKFPLTVQRDNPMISSRVLTHLWLAVALSLLDIGRWGGGEF